MARQASDQRKRSCISRIDDVLCRHPSPSFEEVDNELYSLLYEYLNGFPLEIRNINSWWHDQRAEYVSSIMDLISSLGTHSTKLFCCVLVRSLCYAVVSPSVQNSRLVIEQLVNLLTASIVLECDRSKRNVTEGASTVARVFFGEMSVLMELLDLYTTIDSSDAPSGSLYIEMSKLLPTNNLVVRLNDVMTHLLLLLNGPLVTRYHLVKYASTNILAKYGTRLGFPNLIKVYQRLRMRSRFTLKAYTSIFDNTGSFIRLAALAQILCECETRDQTAIIAAISEHINVTTLCLSSSCRFMITLGLERSKDAGEYLCSLTQIFSKATVRTEGLRLLKWSSMRDLLEPIETESACDAAISCFVPVRQFSDRMHQGSPMDIVTKPLDLAFFLVTKGDVSIDELYPLLKPHDLALRLMSAPVKQHDLEPLMNKLELPETIERAFTHTTNPRLVEIYVNRIVAYMHGSKQDCAEVENDKLKFCVMVKEYPDLLHAVTNKISQTGFRLECNALYSRIRSDIASAKLEQLADSELETLFWLTAQPSKIIATTVQRKHSSSTNQLDDAIQHALESLKSSVNPDKQVLEIVERISGYTHDVILRKCSTIIEAYTKTCLGEFQITSMSSEALKTLIYALYDRYLISGKTEDMDYWLSKCTYFLEAKPFDRDLNMFVDGNPKMTVHDTVLHFSEKPLEDETTTMFAYLIKLVLPSPELRTRTLFHISETVLSKHWLTKLHSLKIGRHMKRIIALKLNPDDLFLEQPHVISICELSYLAVEHPVSFAFLIVRNASLLDMAWITALASNLLALTKFTSELIVDSLALELCENKYKATVCSLMCQVLRKFPWTSPESSLTRICTTICSNPSGNSELVQSLTLYLEILGNFRAVKITEMNNTQRESLLVGPLLREYLLFGSRKDDDRGRISNIGLRSTRLNLRDHLLRKKTLKSIVDALVYLVQSKTFGDEATEDSIEASNAHSEVLNHIFEFLVSIPLTRIMNSKDNVSIPPSRSMKIFSPEAWELMFRNYPRALAWRILRWVNPPVVIHNESIMLFSRTPAYEYARVDLPEGVDENLYFTYWSLTTCDLSIADQIYVQVISHTEARRDALVTEQKLKRNLVNMVRTILAGVISKSPASVNTLIIHMIFPRAIASPDDACFSVLFLDLFLQTYDSGTVDGLRPIDIVRLLLGHIISSLFGLTTSEIENIGFFVCSLMQSLKQLTIAQTGIFSPEDYLTASQQLSEQCASICVIAEKLNIRMFHRRVLLFLNLTGSMTEFDEQQGNQIRVYLRVVLDNHSDLKSLVRSLQNIKFNAQPPVTPGGPISESNVQSSIESSPESVISHNNVAGDRTPDGKSLESDASRPIRDNTNKHTSSASIYNTGSGHHPCKHVSRVRSGSSNQQDVNPTKRVRNPSNELNEQLQNNLNNKKHSDLRYTSLSGHHVDADACRPRPLRTTEPGNQQPQYYQRTPKLNKQWDRNKNSAAKDDKPRTPSSEELPKRERGKYNRRD